MLELRVPGEALLLREMMIPNSGDLLLVMEMPSGTIATVAVIRVLLLVRGIEVIVVNVEVEGIIKIISIRTVIANIHLRSLASEGKRTARKANTSVRVSIQTHRTTENVCIRIRLPLPLPTTGRGRRLHRGMTKFHRGKRSLVERIRSDCDSRRVERRMNEISIRGNWIVLRRVLYRHHHQHQLLGPMDYRY